MIQIGGLKFNSFDYLLVVNREFLIVYGSRYDTRVDSSTGKYRESDYMNRNFFEVYPTVRRESSSIVHCMATGEIVVQKEQQFEDFTGKFFCTNNVTVPIIRRGRIVGAVELVKDVTTVDQLDRRAALQDRAFDLAADQVRYEMGQITFDTVLTQNSAMQRSLENAKVLARLPTPTLIYGETGTGKELVAQAMITYSGIPQSRVVVHNCAAVPENLMESTLFGTARGAYTGAENRRGLFEEADGGVFFMDELNSLPYQVQGKLLRVLQDGSFRPVGSNTEKRVNVKIIAAMNVDPLVAIEKKQLRSDLFYRLSGGMIFLPPLRDRKEDISFFTKYYIDACNLIHGRQVQGVTDALQEFFQHCRWEGNVRELKHTLEAMMSVTDVEFLDVHHLPAYMYKQAHQSEEIEESVPPSSPPTPEKEEFSLPDALERTERELIVRVLRMTQGNKTRAGELLKIPRQTLGYKMNKANISEEEWQ